jgi:hypothetical protein
MAMSAKEVLCSAIKIFACSILFCKTYSYGDTIEFASGEIETKAKDTKGKLES